MLASFRNPFNTSRRPPRRPARSREQKAQDELAAAKLEATMRSNEALQEALGNLYPRIREAFELVVMQNLSTLFADLPSTSSHVLCIGIDEVCEHMRPGNPMNPQTIANYLIKAFERGGGPSKRNHSFEAGAAIFCAIGKEKFIEIVRSADPYHWRSANAFDKNITNARRVGTICAAHREREILVRDIRKGWCRGDEIEERKREIVRILVGRRKKRFLLPSGVLLIREVTEA